VTYPDVDIKLGSSRPGLPHFSLYPSPTTCFCRSLRRLYTLVFDQAMLNIDDRHVLALKGIITIPRIILLPIPTFIHAVIAGENLFVPTDRTPISYYVHVSTSNGRWNTTIKATEAAHSISWNETLNIHRPSSTFLQWLMSIFSCTSEKMHLEIRALYEPESKPAKAYEFETTFERLLGQSSKSSVLALSYIFPSSHQSQSNAPSYYQQPGHTCYIDSTA
jgi:hypothetical protein